MKSLQTLLFVSALVVGASISAQAAAPVFSADTAFTSEDQIFTGGTEVFGGDENFVSATLNDGVSFQTQLRNATFEGTSLSGITVDTDGSGYGAHADTSAFSDGNLNAVMGGDALGSYAQIFIKGLTTGQTYVIQVFASMTQNADIGGGDNNASSVYSATEPFADETQGGSTTLSWGQTYDPTTQTYTGTGVYFFTETFTAAGPEEYLDSAEGQSTSGQAMVSALEIRELPEPSTYAMIGLGLLVMGMIAARRTRAA